MNNYTFSCWVKRGDDAEWEAFVKEGMTEAEAMAMVSLPPHEVYRLFEDSLGEPVTALMKAQLFKD